MNKILLSLSLVLGFGLMLASPVWADFQAGLDAYERGDYETALAEFRALADQGDASAQTSRDIFFKSYWSGGLYQGDEFVNGHGFFLGRGMTGHASPCLRIYS